MRRYRGPDGRVRLWFEPDEIEDIMATELHRAGLTPRVDAPVVDVEAFLERHLRVSIDQYAELDPSVLGVTEFRRGTSPRVAINRDLTGEALDQEESPDWLLGRWRATVAHEGSHVVLHRTLYETDPNQGELFGDENGVEDRIQELQRCLKRDVGFGRASADWREVQANMGMAALLMPRGVFCDIAQRERELEGLPDRQLEKGSATAVRLAARLASLFQVSQQAATIRMETLGVICPEGTKILL
jgi:hypothetical protein